jgi:hypothetical protein
MAIDIILGIILVVLLIKTNNLQRRVGQMELNVQRFMTRVILGKDNDG